MYLLTSFLLLFIILYLDPFIESFLETFLESPKYTVIQMFLQLIMCLLNLLNFFFALYLDNLLLAFFFNYQYTYSEIDLVFFFASGISPLYPDIRFLFKY